MEFQNIKQHQFAFFFQFNALKGYRSPLNAYKTNDIPR